QDAYIINPLPHLWSAEGGLFVMHSLAARSSCYFPPGRAAVRSDPAARHSPHPRVSAPRWVPRSAPPSAPRLPSAPPLALRSVLPSALGGPSAALRSASGGRVYPSGPGLASAAAYGSACASASECLRPSACWREPGSASPARAS